MKTSQRILALFFIALFAVFAFGQDAAPDSVVAADEPARSQFTFTADWNRFRVADSLIYLEYTLAIPRSSLTYKKEEDGKYHAELLVESNVGFGNKTLLFV